MLCCWLDIFLWPLLSRWSIKFRINCSFLFEKIATNWKHLTFLWPLRNLFFFVVSSLAFTVVICFFTCRCYYFRPGPTLLTDLTENGRPASIAAAPPGSSIGGLENVTVKTSSSPPPAHPSSAHGPGVPVNSSLLNQLNQVIVPPMLGMLQQAHVHVHSGGTTTLTDTLLSRHFSHIAQAMGHQSLQQSQSSASHDSASSTTTARGMFELVHLLHLHSLTYSNHLSKNKIACANK